jgi:hypothetical protein
LTLYQGVVTRRRRPALQLLTGRTEIGLELADAGGDLWEALAKPGSKWSGTGFGTNELDLRDSNLFEYAIHAHSLFFFLPADTLTSDSDETKLQIDHLTSLIALILDFRRNTDRDRQMSYAVIVSKCDLLSSDEFIMLESLINSRTEFSMADAEHDLSVNLSPAFSGSILQLERYLAFASRREIRTRIFAVSAVGSALTHGALVGRELESLKLDEERMTRARSASRTLMDSRTAIQPLEWAVRMSLHS